MAWEALQLVKAHLLPMQPAPLVPDCQSSVPYIKASVYRSPLGAITFLSPKSQKTTWKKRKQATLPTAIAVRRIISRP